VTASRFPHPLTLLVACSLLVACGVPYEQWIRFGVPVLGALVALAAAAIGVAVVVGV
jgi:uncharacterized ion transporter superfamily protein YfcC